MSKQAMAMYAHNAVKAADELAGKSRAGMSRFWAPVIANSAAAIAHAICELADAAAGKTKQKKESS